MGAGTKAALIVVFVLLVVVIALAVKSNSDRPEADTPDLAGVPAPPAEGAPAGGGPGEKAPAPSVPPEKTPAAPAPEPSPPPVEPETSAAPPTGETQPPEPPLPVDPSATVDVTVGMTQDPEAFGPAAPAPAGNEPDGTGRGSAPDPSAPASDPVEPEVIPPSEISPSGPPAVPTAETDPALVDSTSPGAEPEPVSPSPSPGVPAPAIDDGTGKVEPSSDHQAEPVKPSPPSTYTVKEGDSLWDIAVRLYGKGALFKLIKEANGLASEDDLQPGLVLKIPAAPAAPSPPPPLPPEDPKYWYHIVLKGETLWGLAQKYLKNATKYTVIVEANAELKKGSPLREGMRIRIPKP